mgnify:FL=1|tara:strand:- start:214 stop:567 length:354 start_codon:yes stop_codon:yes gene_type:complete
MFIYISVCVMCRNKGSLMISPYVFIFYYYKNLLDFCIYLQAALREFSLGFLDCEVATFLFPTAESVAVVFLDLAVVFSLDVLLQLRKESSSCENKIERINPKLRTFSVLQLARLLWK